MAHLRQILSSTIFLLSCCIVQAQTLFGVSQPFNEGWQFQLGDIPQGYSPQLDAAKWRTLDLPHDWSVEAALSPDQYSCTGYLPGGIGWYRKTFTIPGQLRKEKVFVYFEGVYNNSEVFINGFSVGKRPNGYISFIYDLTPYIKAGEENLLAVRVDHSKAADSRWYTGSGIHRNVYLIHSDLVHFDLWGVTYQTKRASIQEASVGVQVDVKNESPESSNVTARVELYSAEGKLIQQKSSTQNVLANAKQKLSFDLTVKQPTLWSINQPYLYTLKTILVRKGEVIDQNETALGIRTLSHDPNKGFALNGEWIKMKGVCIHHDAGVLGAAVPAEVWERRLKNLKVLGVNAIRMSHNPHAPEVYDLCDQLGLLVMDEAFDEWEFPKKKWLTGWNVGTAGLQGSADYFNEWSDRDIRDMVLRDRNHPSIVMWSIGNEVDYPNDPYTHPVLEGTSINQPGSRGFMPEKPTAERLGVIAHRLAKVVRDNDSSRPVTAALAGVIMSNATTYPTALDVAGYNYTEDRYAIDHQAYPNRVIYGSENGHSFDAWKVVRDNDYIFGQFLWTGIDYLGEAGRWPARGAGNGLIDLAGFTKPIGYFRQALWSKEPMIYMGTQPAPQDSRRVSMDAPPLWNYEAGKNIRVCCYTNCSEAKLLLNGKEVGTTKAYDDNTGIISWDIPYQPGKLEAVGLNNSQEVARYSLETSGRPYALIATTDVQSLKKEKGLAHVEVQITDERGIPVFLSDDEITCQIEGPAKLLGLEAGNMRDMGNYQDQSQRAYGGRLLAYIQATGTEGVVKVIFTARWLKQTEVVLKVDTKD